MGNERLSIGEFARQSGLTARALRLYAERGLLSPATTDGATGYRFYDTAQLAEARLISTMRAAGMPLATIEAALADAGIDAHAVVDGWWTGVVAEHASAAAIVPHIHQLLDGRKLLMAEHGTDTRPDDLQLLEAVRAATHGEAIPTREAAPEQVALVRGLIDEGADVNAADSDGWTAMHSVAMSDHTELARLLLDAGARVDAGAHGVPDGTPLAYALFYAQREVAAVVAEAGIVPGGLRTAAALGHLDDLRSFLDGGRPLPDEAADGMGFSGPPWFPPRATPIDDQLVIDESLTWAARNDRLDAMELLVEAGADVNANPFRGTALLWAIFSDAVGAATWLLDHGADPDLRHDFGGPDHGKAATAMHLAAQYGSLRCLRLLLDRGADATIADGAFDSTPLGWARFGEQPDAVALLEAHLGAAS